MNYYYKLSLTLLCCSLAIDTGARQVCVLVYTSVAYFWTREAINITISLFHFHYNVCTSSSYLQMSF
jgi:hypothetical protein